MPSDHSHAIGPLFTVAVAPVCGELTTRYSYSTLAELSCVYPAPGPANTAPHSPPILFAAKPINISFAKFVLIAGEESIPDELPSVTQLLETQVAESKALTPWSSTMLQLIAKVLLVP